MLKKIILRKLLTFLMSSSLLLSGEIFLSNSIAWSVLEWDSEMLKQVNISRQQAGVLPLKSCVGLQKAAQGFASSMAKGNFYSHKGKDGSTPGDRLTKAGYFWEKSSQTTYIGENIAAGQTTVKQVMRGWLNSPPHRRNILSPKFTHVGFGRATSSNSKYGIYWVQNFGSGVKC